MHEWKKNEEKNEFGFKYQAEKLCYFSCYILYKALKIVIN